MVETSGWSGPQAVCDGQGAFQGGAGQAERLGELIETRSWPTRVQARRAIVDYIAWYNGTRLHSSLR